MPTRDPRARVATDSTLWFRFLLCCFVFICGVRLFLVERFAASVAYGDDLDGIARRLLLPWTNGSLSWSALFAAHNGDHRIVATRLWEILWFEINGSWDPKFVMLVKVPVFAAAATIFVHLLTRALDRHRFATAAVLTLLFAFPFAFANALWAFQSQFDFFLLATALAWLAVVHERNITALVIAAASILTLGSGPVIAASFLPYFVVKWWISRERHDGGDAVPPGSSRGRNAERLNHGARRLLLPGQWSLRYTLCCIVAALGIIAIGLASPTKDAMPHAGTPSDKAAMMVRLYGWPYSNLLSIVERLPESARYVPGRLLRFPSTERSLLMRAADKMHHHRIIALAIDAGFAVIVLAPTLFLLLEAIRGRVRFRTIVDPLGLAGFAFLMIVATALARANQVTIAPRFLDHVSLAGFASIAAAAVLWRSGRSLPDETGSTTASKRRRVATWRRIALAGWIVVMGLGYLATMAVTLAQMRRRAPMAALAVLQRYYHTDPHDHAAMTDGGAFHQFIVSDDPTQFMSELDTPDLERVLPLEVTDPGATLGLPSRIARVTGRFGWLIALVSAGLALVLAQQARRTRRPLAGVIASETTLVGA